jgi:hypothetical protein
MVKATEELTAGPVRRRSRQAPAPACARPDAQRGSIVLVALCLVTVLAVAVTGYIAVCARTMELSNRSFCYTSSVQLAEMGLEYALWAIDNKAVNPASFNWSGWTLTTDGSGAKWASRQLTGFTVNKGVPGVVKIQIQYYDHYSAPSVYGTQPPTIISDGVVQMTDGSTIDKQLKVIVRPAALFSNALGSTAPPNSPSFSSFPYGYVCFWYNTTVAVDSYDSSQNGGVYTPSPSTVNRSDQAIVSGPYLYLSNADILGYATTANQNATTPSFDSSGSLKGFGTPSGTTIDSSRISNNGNQNSFDIVTPSGAGSILPTSGSIGPGFYYYTAGTFYQAYGLVLTITGPATIYVSGSVDIEGSIVISSSSTGPVRFFVGDQVYICGPGIDNRTRLPANLAIFGTTTWGNGYLYTNTPFYGVIYMPNTIVYTTGNAGTGYQAIYGSIVGFEVIPWSSYLSIHYDLNLRKTTFSMVNTPYEVTQWIEN